MADVRPSEEVLAAMWRSHGHRFEALISSIERALTRGGGFAASRREVMQAVSRYLMEALKGVATRHRVRIAEALTDNPDLAPGDPRAVVAAESMVWRILADEDLDVLDLVHAVLLDITGVARLTITELENELRT